MLISISTTLTVIGQEIPSQTTRTANDSIVVKPLKQISAFTYEVHIEDIRTANQIFVEHSNYGTIMQRLENENLNLSEQLKLIESNNASLLQDKEELLSIVDQKDQKILNDDTYHKSQLSFIKKQRNTAYIVTIAAILVTVLSITK